MTADGAPGSTCPWCSASIPSDVRTCPSCGANLVETAEPAVPGLTAIDAEAVLRNVRATSTPVRRSRLLSLITGEEPDDDRAVVATPEALAPPAPDVRREMLRMELAAEIADLNAEAESIAADEAVEGGSEPPTPAREGGDRTGG